MASPRWTVRDLGSGSQSGAAWDVDDRGVVVGDATSPDGASRAVMWVNGRLRVLRPQGDHAAALDGSGRIVGSLGNSAVLWRDGRLIRLGTLGGAFADLGSYFYTAVGIDRRGRIFGMVKPEYSNGKSRAFVWEDGKIAGIGGGQSWLGAVGAAAVVGTLERDGRVLPFVWKDGRRTDLPLPRGANGGSAAGVNARGEVAGSATFGVLATPRAVVWRRGKPVVLPLPPGASQSRADAISDSGDVAGEYTRGARFAPVLWRAGRTTTLASRPDCSWRALAIGSDTVVLLQATCFRVGGGQETDLAYVWQNGALVRLPGLGGGTYAAAMNAHTEIVGWAQTRPGGRTRAVAWTPSR